MGLSADIKVVWTTDEFREFLDWLRNRRGLYVAVDTETSSADLLYHPGFQIRLIQVGDTQTGWVLPWHLWGTAVGQALVEYYGRILIHNADFDMAALATKGVYLDWAKVVDTMLAMRIAEPDALSGLKEAATRHVSVDANLTQKDLKDVMSRKNWDWDTVPLELPLYTTYAGWDPILTARLYETDVVQQALSSPVWQLEMDTAKICSRMSARGMKIDVDLCQQSSDRLRTDSMAVRQQMQDDFGLDIGSTQACSKWFQSDPDAAPLMTKTTATGRVSVDKEVVDKILVSIPGTAAANVAAAMAAVRLQEKLAAAYFDTFLERADSNGFVHAQILTSEAKTGRQSIRNPALQTLAKGDAAGVRNVVLPREADHLLISSDYDQIEMRLAAIFSKDAGLLEAFREADASGGDFFTAMGAQIYHDLTFTKADPRRSAIKSAMYGMLYGAGAIKIATTAKIPLIEAQTAVQQIFKFYPGLRSLMDHVERTAKRTGSIETLGGRVLTVPEQAAYKGLNYLIQGSAAVLLKRALVDLACAGLEDYLVVPVHDELVFSVPKDAVEDVRQVIADIMPIQDLPLLIGATPSKGLSRWGEDKK